MKLILQLVVMVIAFYIVWEKPFFLIDLGTKNEGIILFIVLLAISTYVSPAMPILVGTIIIIIIKEGCAQRKHCPITKEVVTIQTNSQNTQDPSEKVTIVKSQSSTLDDMDLLNTSEILRSINSRVYV